MWLYVVVVCRGCVVVTLCSSENKKNNPMINPYNSRKTLCQEKKNEQKTQLRERERKEEREREKERKREREKEKNRSQLIGTTNIPLNQINPISSMLL